MTDPLRTQTAFIIRGGLKNQAGTLLLFPDRLSHVASGAMAAGAMGGAIGMAVANRLAKNKAVAKEAEGGKGVTTLPLANVTEVHKTKQALNKNILGIVTADGTELKLGVKFDDWKSDLIAALTSSGRQVNDGGDIVTVS